MSLATSCSLSFSASSSSIAALTASLSYRSFIAGVHGQDLEWDESESFLDAAGVDDSFLFDRPVDRDFEDDSFMYDPGCEVLDTSDVVVFQGSGYVSQSDIPVCPDLSSPTYRPLINIAFMQLPEEVLPTVKRVREHLSGPAVHDQRRRLLFEIQRQEQEHRQEMHKIRRDLGIIQDEDEDWEDDVSMDVEEAEAEVPTVDMLGALEERARQNGTPWGYF
ncbi:hypothetical protein PQX77_015126 [Marasmius sp. AFHP31]|nr:hypothetical protein PQX77_015126 [Marasmius sp. AFHP31]